MAAAKGSSPNSKSEATIEVLVQEGRTFPPTQAFKAQAIIKDESVYEEAERDYDRFWLARAREFVAWDKEPTKGLDWNPPDFTFFADGKLNVAWNCVDKHVQAGKGDKVAYHWVPEPLDEPHHSITYAQLADEVGRVANALKELGVRKGDRVGIYLGMVPEMPITMLACARLGAPHVVVYGGFSADSLGTRLADTEAKVLVTQNEGWRKGNRLPFKDIVDDACTMAPSVEHVLVLRRTDADVPMQDGRDVWWHDVVGRQPTDCPPEIVDAEDMLYILHTSGTTAKPKGAQHCSGGYLTYVSVTHKWIFDIHDDDVWWCAADIGWVTGHSYIVYGPLNNGTTGVMYEGDPMYPNPHRTWEIIERYKVTQYYTAPTLIRAFIKVGHEIPQAHDLSSLKLLGTVGEPINPEAWVWYWRYIGGERCPVVDTWWQTETGGILITPLPGITTLKPGSATLPFPGIHPAIVDEVGKPVAAGHGGYLVMTRPWPGMFRTLYNDHDRWVDVYLSKYGPDTYFVGDGGRQDDEGYYWLLGRIDDVMNVSGHRLSTTEIESALVAHEAVAEAATAAAPDSQTGQVPLCFVLLRSGYEPSEKLAGELREWVGQKIGKIARPKAVIFSADLPKTRSGKIMRRLLKDIAEGRPLGDTTTLRDPAIVEDIKQQPGGFGDRCVVLHEEHALVHGRLRRYPTAAPVMRRPPGRERSFTPASALGAMQRPHEDGASARARLNARLKASSES
ncbi:MAG TPA: acetate--CoA ligase [Acidimicrobiia bacterium]|nr:acetate--CoA ligase [Acidimicrobiia bacterium]